MTATIERLTMPCKSDHMEPNQREVEYSRVLALLAELDGNGEPSTSAWRGYHPQAYCKRILQSQLDNATARLCQRLQNTKDVSVYSLELQKWWRDHQRADAERAKKTKQKKRDARLRKSAMAKLTNAEKRALNLKTD